MSRAHSKDLSQSYKIKRAEEVLRLSEQLIIEALNGTMQIDDKERLKVALELYKRRIPAKVESENTGNKLTMIKIVKNFLPEQSDELSPIEVAAENVLNGRNLIDKVREEKDSEEDPEEVRE